MGRRKHQLLDDEDPDSSAHSEAEGFGDEDPDFRDERALFEDPYQHKKRGQQKRGFYDDSDGEGEDARPSRRRSDWTKAPAFVSSQKVEPDQSMDVDADSNADRDAAKDEDSDEDQGGSQPSVPKSVSTPRDEDEVMGDRPRFGLGASRSTGSSGLGFTQAGIGSRDGTSEKSTFSAFSRGGIGSTFTKGPSTSEQVEDDNSGGQKSSFSTFKRGGIGSSSFGDTTTTPSEFRASLPKAFGATRTQRSFVRDDTDSAGSSRSATPNLSAQERAHFSKLEGSYGARMLAKMGWLSGSGLGVSGEGRVVPVETKVRKKGMGIAFGGFSERTDQEKAEARRRGLLVSDDEDVTPGKGKGKAGARKEPADAWKRPKKVKTKIEHKTYEEILAETGDSIPVAAGIGPIIDATGATLREVSSIAEVSLSSWTPTSDATRIPEVRHNLRLVVESTKGDLEGLAREAKALEARKKHLREEDARLRRRIKDEADLIARLQQIHLVVDDINSEAKKLSASYEPTLDPFVPSFDKLLGQFSGDFDRYRLDEVFVAAISPVLRRSLVTWNPLEDPSWLMPTFHLWRRALKVSPPTAGIDNQVQLHGSVDAATIQLMTQQMTPFDSWLWHAWLPRVRSAINNEWAVEDPQPVIRLYEAWANLLPGFIRDNFFDQLVIPKLQKGIAEWSPRKSNVPLHSLIFPWLPHVGLRIEEVLGDARRKLKSQMKGWTPRDGVPLDFLVWKDVHNPSEWDNLLLKYVVPQLGATLREDFQVDPAQQNLEPFQDVLAWAGIIRSSIFSQLLETGFFPKWLDALHKWLVHPGASFEEVAQWYSSWKRIFPEDVQRMSGVERGFTKGLELMNKAIELGPAVSQLPLPDLQAEGVPVRPAKSRIATKVPSSRTQEITFRSIVDDYASSHNLMFFPAGKVDEKSGHALFRVSKSADGKGGLLVYIADDAVWATDGEQYRAIPLEEMVLRASKG